MKRLGVVFLVGLFFTFIAGTALAQNNDLKPPPGKHYNLNIIGFANCEMDETGYPDCYKGGGDGSQGHTIFVPLKTKHTSNICDSGSSLPGELTDVTVLQKGVRIMVGDGPEIGVVDRDATDGKARFTIPYGQYEVYARALGKPGSEIDPNCMEIDTLLCYDYMEVDTDVWQYVQVNCDEDLNNDKWVLSGYLDVKRTKGVKPKWENATVALLGGTGILDGATYLDFMWQIYNENLKLLQLRFYEVDN